MVLFELVIVIVHIDAELHFLDNNLLLILLGDAILFLLLIQELAVVHNAADRRLCRGRNLNQIQILLASHLQCFKRREDPNLFPFVVNHANFAATNLFIDTNETLIDTILRALASFDALKL